MTKLYCDTSNLINIQNCIKKYNINGGYHKPVNYEKRGGKKI